MENVAVVGDGAWGTALGLVLSERGASVTQWSQSSEYAELMQRTRSNPRYLPGVRLPQSLTVTANAVGLDGADLVVFAVPSRFLRDVGQRLASNLGHHQPLVSATKGLEFPSHKRATEILRETLGERPLAVISGPSHAEEVARRMPTAVVSASHDRGLALRVQDLFTTDRFRVYTSSDPVGVELGGALKNVLAIAGGMVDGLELGDNAKAALLTRGQAEMVRLGVRLGGRAETFGGLSGVGDLVVTCMSRHGRNRLVGERLGRGDSLARILESIPGVPEGVHTCKAVVALADRLGVEVPISREVHAVLFDGKDPRRAVNDLMTRSQKEEQSV